MSDSVESAIDGVSESAIEVRGVRFAYPGVGSVLDGVSLDVRAGERLGVLGPNGGGKSTLLKVILGLVKPAAGSVRVLGEEPVHARRAGLVGYLAQKVAADLHFPLSVRQVVAMPASLETAWWRGETRAAREAAMGALALVGSEALAERPIKALSGGQLQRVMIARAVVNRPKVLLLDEPTVGIDVEGQRRFGELVEHLRGELGLTVVTVSHDLRTVATTSDRVACLRRTLHYHDAPAGLTPAVLREVFSHDVEAVFGTDGVHVNHHPGEGHPHEGHPHEGHPHEGHSHAHGEGHVHKH